MTTSRSRRLVGALASAAGIPLLALAFAAPASAVSSGDWAAAQPTSTVQPGTTTVHKIIFTCESAAGCDYGPGGPTISSVTASGATYINDLLPGVPINLALLTGDNNTNGNVGLCTVAATAVDCTFFDTAAGTGHANQGDQLVVGPVGKLLLKVPASVPPDTVVAQDHLAAANGNDQSNDSAQVLTPPVDGSPMADWTIAGGALGGLALLAGAGGLVRRRKVSATV